MTIDPALGELLSAYLDGELTVDETEAVQTRLARDPSARQELAELAIVRTAVRGLPAVDRPASAHLWVTRPTPREADDAIGERGPGNASDLDDGDMVVPVIELASRRRRHRAVAVTVGGVAATAVVVAALVVVAGGGGTDPMVPPTSEFATRHEVMAELVAGGATEVPDMPDDFEPLDPDAMGDEAPARLPSGFERMAGFEDSDGTTHVVYAHDGMAVSVYRQQGRVDFAGLPPGGRPMEMEGSQAWFHTAETRQGTEEMMVLQRGETVYTFVAAVPHDAMVSVVEDVAFS